jgi:imidazolonepropionase
VSDLVVRARRLVTCDPLRATADDPLGTIENAAIRIREGRVDTIVPDGNSERLDEGAPTIEADLVTPGLVDAHTHAAWVGSRHDEYAIRMAGGDYEAIARAGGGIVASMRAIRAASVDELTAALAARLRRMAAQGVTTVEVKSGYGLSLEAERKQLEAIARCAADPSLPRVVATYLALHALPPEAAGDRDAFAARVVEHELPAIAALGLCRFVDAYVDRSAFSVAQARPLCERARALGLGVRLHVGQFADVGGASLAAEVGAHSVDHVEHLGTGDAERLAKAGVAAVLLPVASYTLRQDPPPIALLRNAGVRLVVASDANPGTAPTESLPLAMAFAVRSYGLTVAETIAGATSEAARSLALPEQGVVRAGAAADLAGFELPHEAALVQPWGTSRLRFALRDGRVIA